MTMSTPKRAGAAVTTRIMGDGYDKQRVESQARPEHRAGLPLPPSTEAVEEEADGNIVVTTLVSGAFPGSPVRLRHPLTIRDGLIGAPDIRP